MRSRVRIYLYYLHLSGQQRRQKGVEGEGSETERHSNWNCKVSLHIFWVCVRHGECHGNDRQKFEKYDICRRDGKKLNSCLWVNKKDKEIYY